MSVLTVLPDGTLIGDIGAAAAVSRTLNKRKSPARSLADARVRSGGASASSRAVPAALAPKTPISSNTGLPGALGPAQPSKPRLSPASSLAQARPTVTAPILVAAAPSSPELKKRKRPASPEEAGAELGEGAAAVAAGEGGGWGGFEAGGYADEVEAAASSMPSDPGDGIPKWAAFAAIGVVLVAGVWAFNAGKF